MRTPIRWFVIGIATTVAVLIIGGYVFVRAGGVPIATNSHPLPLEERVARTAILAKIGNAAEDKNPLAADDISMLAGVTIFQQNCAVCHSVPRQPRTAISQGMFPSPPQFFEQNDMDLVVKVPTGITYWKVTHGIRLTGMPGFENTLSDTERWQVTTLLANLDKLSATVQEALQR
jgi:mono/diheme cytochrome c family protein